MNKKSH